MMDKIRYYLRHDRERIRIAMNGYQKVRQYYSYEIQVGKMMKCVEKEMQEGTT
jgi:spore maturation protein CgeB